MSKVIKHVIRPLEMHDVPIVATIAKSAMPFPWSESVFRDCLKADYHAWVITLGDHGFANEVLGFVVVLLQVGEGQMLNIAVRAKHQGQGLGHQLLDHAIAFVKQQGAHRMTLEVRSSNQAAVEFYQSLGFGQVGVRREYYSKEGGREDALLFYLDT